MKNFRALVYSLSIVSALASSSYKRTDEIIGDGFYEKFEFQAIPDPTHGRVNYVDKSTARKLNLTFTTDDTFVLRTDFKTVLTPEGPGRNSVRIRSKKTYTTHVAVFDIRHMAEGCATWPAIWEVKEEGWPAPGEMDILEGVNDMGKNAFTAHTSPNCAMPAKRNQTGTNRQLDCNTEVNYNTGCGVTVEDENSYGPNFNDNGGGWYAFERTEHEMKGWFWPRDSKSVPKEVRNGAKVLSTDQWGIPAASFPDTTCDFPSHFHEHNIIINLTLCGDWADAVYGQSGCPGTCVDFVNNNPAKFVNAYFDIASIRVYEPGTGDGDPDHGPGKPGDGKPGDGKPGNDKPGKDKPGNGKPGNDKPEPSKPGNDKPGNDKPGNNKPEPSKPGKNKPGNKKPGQCKPKHGKRGHGGGLDL